MVFGLLFATMIAGAIQYDEVTVQAKTPIRYERFESLYKSYASKPLMVEFLGSLQPCASGVGPFWSIEAKELSPGVISTVRRVFFDGMERDMDVASGKAVIYQPQNKRWIFLDIHRKLYDIVTVPPRAVDIGTNAPSGITSPRIEIVTTPGESVSLYGAHLTSVRTIVDAFGRFDTHEVPLFHVRMDLFMSALPEPFVVCPVHRADTQTQQFTPQWLYNISHLSGPGALPVKISGSVLPRLFVQYSVASITDADGSTSFTTVLRGNIKSLPLTTSESLFQIPVGFRRVHFNPEGA